MDNRFGKNEKLCSEIKIKLLFDEGLFIKKFPIRLGYISIKLNKSFPIQVLIIVPKRNFKRAVDRNRLKRLIREAYRLNNKALCDYCIVNNIQFAISLHYIAKEELNFKIIERSVKFLISDLLINENNK